MREVAGRILSNESQTSNLTLSSLPESRDCPMFKSVRPVSENIIASILYALLILGGGALLAVLKKRCS
jgi:hypothetical protein